jgi:3-oxoacyl-[acyl-carrier-protein] synthase-3
MNAYITALSAFLPNAPVDNDHMETVLGMVGDKPSRARRMILRSNGIKTRHYALDPATGEPTHNNAQLAAEAIRGLARPGFDPQEVDLLAVGTTMADQIMPNHAVMVHGEMKWRPLEVVANAGICLSSLSALKYAAMAVAAGEARHAVAGGSELSGIFLRSRFLQPELDSQVAALEAHPEIAFEKDFLRWMLSDGAGMALVEPEPAPGTISLKIEWIVQRSFADTQAACMYAGAEKMPDGRLKGWKEFAPQEWLDRSVFVVKQDVKQLNANVMPITVEKGMREVLRLHPELTPEAVDWFLPHYSSDYFREKAAQSLRDAGFEIPFEKWFTNLAWKGNTGSASIFIILEELFHSGKLKPGQRLLCYVPESGRMNTGFMLLSVCPPAA